jgi:hypothetical protein
MTSGTFVGGDPGTRDVTALTKPGFYWRYDHYDPLNRICVYAGHGETARPPSSAERSPTGRIGFGRPRHVAVPDTDLAIDYSEARYNGTLRGKPESPFTVALTCNPGGPSSLTQPWLDLTTYAGACGPVSTRVGAATLTDHGVQAGGINYDWTFTPRRCVIPAWFRRLGNAPPSLTSPVSEVGEELPGDR